LQNPRSSRWRVGLERTLLSRTPASADLDSDALISAPPEGDASSTVPTPRARGWRSLTRTRPSSDVPCRLRGHQCVGSDRPPAAMSDVLRRTLGLTRADQVAIRTIGLGPHDHYRDACLRIVPSPLSWRVGPDVRLRPRKRALAPFRFDPTAAARSTPLPLVPSKLGHPNPSRPCSTRGRDDRDAYDRKLPITLVTMRAPTVRAVTATVSRFRAAFRGA